MKVRKWVKFSVVMLFMVSVQASASSALANPSTLPETLKCIYEFSISAQYKDGKWEAEKNNGFSFVLTNINIQNRSARMIGSGGSAEVDVVATTKAITFVELTPSGNYNVTSIFLPYKSQDSDSTFLSVHSRHINFSSSPFPLDPLPSQFYGKCVRWE
jgi:hypothetical protein